MIRFWHTNVIKVDITNASVEYTHNLIGYFCIVYVEVFITG